MESRSPHLACTHRCSWSLLIAIAAFGSFASPLEIRTPTFSLTINEHDCTANATFEGRRGVLVPLVSLYNQPTDNHVLDLEPCTSVSVLATIMVPMVPGTAAAASLASPLLLRVIAAHGYGHVDLAVTPSTQPTGHVYFKVADVSGWSVEPTDRHIQFGEYWRGTLANGLEPPLMMGKLQGPRGAPGTGVASAGFMSVSVSEWSPTAWSPSIRSEYRVPCSRGTSRVVSM